METTEILLLLLLVIGVVSCWLLWEIHQKIHKTLEVQWQSFAAFEKRLDEILKRIK
jgi:hypothetical protein